MKNDLKNYDISSVAGGYVNCLELQRGQENLRKKNK